jgi:NAD-dependent deacetylase
MERVWQANVAVAILTAKRRQYSVAARLEIFGANQSYVMRVLVITGAGVSAESGIPTFRGTDGYWRNLDPIKLATPEAFAHDPELVWQWYRERRQRIRNAQPNAAHEAIAKLAQCTGEFLLVTQNVDDLHQRAGLPMQKMVQIHGDIFVTKCSRCDWRTELWEAGRGRDDCKSGLAGARPFARQGEQEKNHDMEYVIPRCPECHALTRPDVVWFGEPLPSCETERVENYLQRAPCGAVIVAGTTATFGYIIDWALRASHGGGELIEVNPEETLLSRFATRLVREPAAVALPRIVDQMINS